MKKTFLTILLLATIFIGHAQSQFDERPKLVVGVMVDQMRWDYLSRYYSSMQSDGLRRLIDEGYSFDNCLINYVPTVTAIGHTSVYTGTTPAFHGICGNSFYIDGRRTYCTDDATVETVGSNSEKGRMSPRNMLATTIGDQLRMHTDFRSKVIGVSYKDRAAILPAGHSATAAYWLDTRNLKFISSTYYMDRLPEWAEQQNSLMEKDKELQRHGKDIGMSPYCGAITTDMAIAALHGEDLGKGDATDMLCISYSQTDVIGHALGTRGEAADAVYKQLDKDIARLLKALDSQVGKGNYLLFLTADHGAAHNYQWMQAHKLPAGKMPDPDIKNRAEQYVASHLGNIKKVIASEMNYFMFIDKKSVADQGLDYEQVKSLIIESLKTTPHVQWVVDMERVATSPLPEFLRERIAKGYHYRRSGDVLYIPEPGYYNFGSWSSEQGTTHGEWNPYDSHIPCLFYGWKISHGATCREVHITDIAPTVCSLLHIQQPNACSGEPMTEITK